MLPLHHITYYYLLHIITFILHVLDCICELVFWEFLFDGFNIRQEIMCLFGINQAGNNLTPVSCPPFFFKGLEPRILNTDHAKNVFKYVKNLTFTKAFYNILRNKLQLNSHPILQIYNKETSLFIQYINHVLYIYNCVICL